MSGFLDVLGNLFGITGVGIVVGFGFGLGLWAASKVAPIGLSLSGIRVRVGRGAVGDEGDRA